MNVKKAIKRIAALAAGTTMVTATIMGAVAYDLSNYPEPLVKNGVFDGKIVVGRTAAVTDVIGAIDLAASLQAAATTPVTGTGPGTVVTVTGGVQIKSSSRTLHFGDAINSVNSGEYGEQEFPEILSDGIIEADDGTDYEFAQTISVPSAEIVYRQERAFGDDPLFFLNLAAGANPNIQFSVDFFDLLPVTEFDNSESIEMFGKVYTFDPNHAVGDDLTLYGSDLTVSVSQNQPETIRMDGTDYTVEILGGNTLAQTAIIRVTSGTSSDTRTLEAGQSRRMAGLDLFVSDVFISDIGEAMISVNIFFGSEKLIIPSSAIADTACIDAGHFSEVTIGTTTRTRIRACVQGDDLSAVSALHFRVNPTDFDNPDTNRRWQYLPMGSSFDVPFFDFSLSFDGFAPSIESRPVVDLNRLGDAYELVFTNNRGHTYEIELVEIERTSRDSLLWGYDGDFIGDAGETTIPLDAYFILESNHARLEDRITYVFEVLDIDDQAAGTGEIELYELGSRQTRTFRIGNTILDTDAAIDTINVDDFTITGAGTKDYVIARGGLVVRWDNLTAVDDELNIWMMENPSNFKDLGPGDDSTVEVTVRINGDDELDLSPAVWDSTANVQIATDRDNDYRYGISEYGTWFKQEVRDESDYLRVYYAPVETEFLVFLKGPDAVVVTSGTSAPGEAYVLNEMVVGQIAVYDNEAHGMIGTTPLLVVGGPCVNVVAQQLMGNPESCADGFVEGRAKIKLWANQNAILVAGYSGEDTTGGARVLAGYKDYDLRGNEMEVITTDLRSLEVVPVN